MQIKKIVKIACIEFLIDISKVMEVPLMMNSKIFSSRLSALFGAKEINNSR